MVLQDWQKIIHRLKHLESLMSKRQEVFNKLIESVIYEMLKENTELRKQLKLLEVKT